MTTEESESCTSQVSRVVVLQKYELSWNASNGMQ